MKKWFVLLLTIISLNSVSAQTAKQKVIIEKEIRKLDRAHAEAVLRGDLAAMDQYWTEDFIVNNPFNEIDRADRVRNGTVSYASFVREPEAISLFGDTVVVMGHEIVVPKGTSPDAGKTLTRRYTNIWMRRSGKWRLVARHASVVCPK
jgi:ketosteroid isomerase-like protein